MDNNVKTLNTQVCILGSGPAAHTAAIYAARAQLKPILLEGRMANDIALGGQLTTTSDMEKFQGFSDGILGIELMDQRHTLSKVYILHRRDVFRASKIMQTRALSIPKIQVM